MTLSFSTKWPERMGELAGQPNYFIEKIYASGILKDDFDYTQFRSEYLHQFDDYWDGWNSEFPNGKLHTIRKGNRWKAGMKIHPVINNRTKNRFQFATVLECKSVQEIEFYWWKPESPELYSKKYDDVENERYCDLYINGSVQFDEQIEKLALNDGFPSVDAFFQYFNQDFKGQLIHWTDLKY